MRILDGEAGRAIDGATSRVAGRRIAVWGGPDAFGAFWGISRSPRASIAKPRKSLLAIARAMDSPEGAVAGSDLGRREDFEVRSSGLPLPSRPLGHF